MIIPMRSVKLANLETKTAYESMFNANLLILVGTDYPYAPYLNQHIPAIQIDWDPSKIGHRHNVALSLVADAQSALTLLNAREQVVNVRPFLAACQKICAFGVLGCTMSKINCIPGFYLLKCLPNSVRRHPRMLSGQWM